MQNPVSRTTPFPSSVAAQPYTPTETAQQSKLKAKLAVDLEGYSGRPSWNLN